MDRRRREIDDMGVIEIALTRITGRLTIPFIARASVHMGKLPAARMTPSQYKTKRRP